MGEKSQGDSSECWEFRSEFLKPSPETKNGEEEERE